MPEKILAGATANFISYAARQAVNHVTNDTATRIGSHAAIQAVKNYALMQTPLSVGLGAISGAGYCITAQAKQKLKDEGRDDQATWVGIAGVYVTEFAQGAVRCFADRNTPCRKYMAMAALAGTAILMG